MGKKRLPKNGGSVADLQDCDGGSSVASSHTTCRPDFDEQDDAVDVFSAALDDLLEKRGSTREAALSTLLASLRQEVLAQEAARNQVTIIGRCINCLRRGGAVEAARAAELLTLHLLTLPEQSENNFLEAQHTLEKAATSGASAEVRVAATEALAMACFLSVDDYVLCLRVMERLCALWTCKGADAGDTRAVAAALRGWALLLTALPAPLPPAAVEAVLGQLAVLLHAASGEVRTAAGEALALLYSQGSARGVLQRLAGQGPEDDDDYDEGGGQDDAGGSECGGGAAPDGGDVVMADGAGAAPSPALLSRLRQLAVAHPSADPLRRSKRDRAAQRTAFRALLAAVERGGGVAATKVKLPHGGALVVDTLEGGVRLAAFRRALAGGFQVHLQDNPLLHAVFGFTPMSGPRPRLTALEKRATRSQNSADAKWRTADRKGGRAHKTLMMGGGGEDY